MIEIDGSLHSGSGTILRYATSLATLKRESLHMTRIRAKRPKPGLRAQHLRALSACAELCGGRIETAHVGSQEITYHPGTSLEGGSFHIEIGTAGSAAMLAFTLIPLALFSSAPTELTILGGLFQDFAPSFFHMDRVLVRVLRAMGANITMRMDRPGYVPEGQGILFMRVSPCRALKPIRLTEQGTVQLVKGIALSSHLRDQAVSSRMARRSSHLLEQKGFFSNIDVLDDDSAVQRGAALILWAETTTGCVLGADRAGKQGRKSEDIADYVVRSLVEDLASGACTDRHLADQLILFAALAEGTSEFTIPLVTDHVEANLWLVEHILGVRHRIRGNLVTLEGIGMRSAVS